MPTSSNPAISVITATRNRTDLLARALHSIAAQEFQDYEAIVIDDGSDADAHPFHEKLFAELPPNFHLHRVRPPGSAGAGPASARNAGIVRARGDYLAFLDDDDYWIRTDHLGVAFESLRSTNADYFFANMQGMRGTAILTPDWFPNSSELTRGKQITQAVPVYEVSLQSFLRVMKHHFSHPDCWVVARKTVEAAGGFWDKVRVGEDVNLMLRIADWCDRILYRPDCVTAYRYPEGNSVSLSFDRQEEHLQIFLAAAHAASSCRQKAVRRCALARQSWHLRQLAMRLLQDQRPVAAFPFAWVGFSTYPTLGGLVQIGTVVLRMIAQAGRDHPSRITIDYLQKPAQKQS